MSRHRKIHANLSSHNFGGLRVRSDGKLSEIGFGFNYKSWPKLANRLIQRGHSVRSIFENRRLLLETSASADEIRALVGSRSAKIRSKKAVYFLPVALCLGLLAFIPMGDGKEMAEARKPAITDHCNETELANALESDIDSSYLKEIESMTVGGIEIGKISCDNQGYSYTLDLSKTKRVLKLQKLDS